MVKENTMQQTEIGLIPEDWEVIRLGDYGTLKNGYAFPSVNFSDNGPIVMTPGNFKLGGGLKFLADKTIRYKGRFTKEMKFSNGDLVMVMTDLTPDCNLLGKAGIIDTDEIILHNQRIGKIELSKNIHSKYLCYYFNSELFSLRMKNTATGSTVRHTSTPTVKNTNLPLPPLPEQQAIAEALSDADAWIESLEDLIAKKRLIKQGAMQELLTPKEAWEVKKLGEICEFGNGRDFKHLKSGEIPVYGTGGIMTYVDQYLYEGSSVGIGRKGTIDKPVFLTGKFWTVDTLFFTHSFVNTDPQYLYYQFLLIPWKEYNEASGVPSLNKNTLAQIEILIPYLTEQTRIATILSDMDTEIEQLEQKLTKARQIKQGMMQELLTGRVRLV